MYEITVERGFWASHTIRLYDGSWEVPHHHWWIIRLTLGADLLDEIEVVMDFHELEQIIDRALVPFKDADVNAMPAFKEVNPTAERMVKHIHDLIDAQLPERVTLISSSLREAEGCWATWRAD